MKTLDGIAIQNHSANMFWLLRKIFTLGILLAVIFLAFNLPIAGKPLKDHLWEFYYSPTVQTWVSHWVGGLPAPLSNAIKKDMDHIGPAPAMEEYKPDEEQELNKILKKEIKK